MAFQKLLGMVRTKEGFVIHVTVDDKPLVFAVGNSWNSALTNLKKACERFNFDNGNANDNKATFENYNHS